MALRAQKPIHGTDIISGQLKLARAQKSHGTKLAFTTANLNFRKPSSMNTKISYFQFWMVALVAAVANLSQAEPMNCKDLYRDNSVSTQLSWLEQDSPQRTAWLQAQNHDINAKMKASPNATAVSEWIRQVFKQKKEIATIQLDPKTSLLLKFNGVGKGTDLLLKKEQGRPEVLFSNRDILKNLNATLLDITLSPNKKQVLITYVKKGSLDDFFHLVYDLELRKVISPEISSSLKTPFWVSDSSFYTELWNAKTNENSVLEMQTNGVVLHDLGSGEIIDRKLGWAIINLKEKVFFVGTKGEVIHLDGFKSGAIVGVDKNNIYFLKDDEKFGEISSIAKIEGSKPRVLVPESSRLILNPQILEGYLIYESSLVDDRKIVVANMQGQTLHEIELPRFASGHVTGWKRKGQVLKLDLRSDIVASLPLSYDLATARWSKSRLEEKLLTYKGVKFKSEVIQAVQSDGVAIPVRLTYRADTPLDGSRPAYIEVYGGFNLAGYFAPNLNPLNRGFMWNGGILVHPAIRGGNEFGPQWHSSAMKEHKQRTFDDVISVAKTLVDRKYTSSKKIVLTGTSNGGMVVAASALKSPSSFGMVIPISGVEDMLGKERLDRRMDEGWADEYGDSRTSSGLAYLLPYAPVEKAKFGLGLPYFLIINGRNDSRVNPAHSMKLQEALEKDKARHQPSDLLSLRNSGHWLTSAPYQDLIAWRADSVIWTSVYDFLGMRFKSPDSE
jgi:prolyl oligopeptidase